MSKVENKVSLINIYGIDSKSASFQKIKKGSSQVDHALMSFRLFIFLSGFDFCNIRKVVNHT